MQFPLLSLTLTPLSAPVFSLLLLFYILLISFSFFLSPSDSLPFSSICRSQQTWDIGVQTVTQGHRPQLPWLLPLLLWPWRQSKIHLTSSLHFIPLPLAYLLMPTCPQASLIYKGNMGSIFSQMHHCQLFSSLVNLVDCDFFTILTLLEFSKYQAHTYQFSLALSFHEEY